LNHCKMESSCRCTRLGRYQLEVIGTLKIVMLFVQRD
jgi:hypothetical protein